MNNINFLKNPNSIINDYSDMEKIILSEISKASAVPRHLMGKDGFALYKTFMGTRIQFDNAVVSPLLTKIYKEPYAKLL